MKNISLFLLAKLFIINYLRFGITPITKALRISWVFRPPVSYTHLTLPTTSRV